MNKFKQNGVALISILIIVAIVSGIVSTMWERQHKNFERTQYIQAQQQALNYMYSAEAYFRHILKKGLEKDRKYTSLNKFNISATIKSAQSTMSLNNVVNVRSRFISLNNTQVRVFNCLTKPDSLSIFLVKYYDDLKTPDKFEFETVGQLKEIKDIKKVFYKIKGNFNAWKKGTKISIRGSSKKMLLCLLPDSYNYIDEIWDKANGRLPRPNHLPYRDFTEFFSDLESKGISYKREFIQTVATIDINYFTVQTNMTIDKINFTGETIFKREGGTGKSKITILKRSFN